MVGFIVSPERLSNSLPTRDRTLSRLLARTSRLIQRGQEASAALSRWRLGLFLTGGICVVSLYRLALYHEGNWALAGFVAIFLVIAAYHNRLEHRIHRLTVWKHIKQMHGARLRLDWGAITIPAVTEPASHLYARDLDLLGPKSLLHLLDTTISSQGRDRLASWLFTQPPAADIWTTRQRLVRELSRMTGFRDRLVVQARLIGEQEINGQRITAVLQHPIGLSRLNAILPAQLILAAATWTLGIGALLDWLPNYWMLSFGLYAFLYFLTDQGEELLEQAVGLHHELEKLGTVLAYVERHASRRGTTLREICAPLLDVRSRPSRHIRRAARVLHAISVKAHPLVHVMANAAGPWDLWWMRQLQGLQVQLRSQLPIWLDRLADVEAASALATFAYLHPAYAWPTPLTTGDGAGSASSVLATRDLGHPLIAHARRVTNHLTLDGLGRISLVTGSNMSGKSTFLRTVGINLCLAQAGAPVCAGRFEWRWCRLACCIRVDDSLDAGLSFFYAEVKRLKYILDAAQDRAAPPVLFLIDEIFKGTNNRERLIGSRAYITELAKGNGFGLVTTHDLELTDLDKTIPNLTNAHFQETVAGAALEFDYTLRPGPCPTTNALRIMELEGLPVAHQRTPPHA